MPNDKKQPSPFAATIDSAVRWPDVPSTDHDTASTVLPGQLELELEPTTTKGEVQ